MREHMKISEGHVEQSHAGRACRMFAYPNSRARLAPISIQCH